MLEFVKEIGLSIENRVDQAYDYGWIMSGKYNGVQALLTKKYEAWNIHFYIEPINTELYAKVSELQIEYSSGHRAVARGERWEHVLPLWGEGGLALKGKKGKKEKERKNSKKKKMKKNEKKR